MRMLVSWVRVLKRRIGRALPPESGSAEAGRRGPQAVPEGEGRGLLPQPVPERRLRAGFLAANALPQGPRAGLHRFLARTALRALPCLFVLCGTAWAHSELLATAPAEGAVLPAPPPSIGLTFNEPISPLVLRLLGPGGKSFDLGAPEIRGGNLTVPLPAQLDQGGYLFSWRVASADGHPVGGTLSFAIGAASTQAAEPAPSNRAAGLYAAIAITGLALLAGLLFGVGGVSFDAWAAQYDPGSCRRHLPPLVLAFIAAPVSLGLQGVDALAAPWPVLFTRACWAAAMSTTYGTLALLAEAAALAGLFACVSGSARWRRMLALTSILLLGLALASSGHAATATVGIAARAAVFLHVIAVAAWLGALVCLPCLLLGGYGETALRRFSAGAVIIVVLLAATGILLAWWQLRTPRDLWQTGYGRILAAKLVLVLGLLALGARNRWRWTSPVLKGDAGALKALVRNIRWEIALAVGVLCAVALWRFTPPPRALPADHGLSRGREIPNAIAPSATSAVRLRGGGAEGQAIIVAKPHGHAQVTLSLRQDGGPPLRAKEVTVTFSNARIGVEGIVRLARPAPQGETWIVDDAPLLVPGAWDIKVDALVSDFDSISLQGQGRISLENAATR